MVTVDSITYSTTGGRDNGKHLNVTVAVSDAGSPVAGVLVSVDITNGNATESASNVTGPDGTVLISWKHAPGGCFTTAVTAVNASGSDGVTPANSFCR